MLRWHACCHDKQLQCLTCWLSCTDQPMQVHTLFCNIRAYHSPRCTIGCGGGSPAGVAI